jgi:hypothetical protein
MPQNVQGKPTTLLNWLSHNGFNVSQMDLNWLAWLQDTQFGTLSATEQRSMLDTMYSQIQQRMPIGQDPAKWMQQSFAGIFNNTYQNTVAQRAASGSVNVAQAPFTADPASASAQQIIQAYQRYLGRQPSLDDIANWQDTGMAIQQIQGAIQNSPEAATYHGQAAGPAGLPGAPIQISPGGPQPGTQPVPVQAGAPGQQPGTGQVPGVGGAPTYPGAPGVGGITPTSVSAPSEPAPYTDPVTGRQMSYQEFARELQPVFGDTAMATFGGTQPWAEAALQYELTGEEALGTKPADWAKGGLMAGYKFTGGISGQDILNVLQFAEKFTSLTGAKYTIPMNKLDEWARIPGLDQEAFNQLAWTQMPASLQQQAPGLQHGLSQTQWATTLEEVQGQYYNWTGTRDMPQPVIDQLLKDHGGKIDSNALDQWIRADPTTQSKAPWMAAGLTYQAWQDYQKNPANKQAAMGRFGSLGANNANILTNLLNPLSPSHAAGGPITPQQRGTINYTTRGQAPVGFQSEVR